MKNSKKLLIGLIAVFLLQLSVFGVLLFYTKNVETGELGNNNQNSQLSNSTKNNMKITYPIFPPVENIKSEAIFANGCFWCVEYDLEKLPGVISAVSGYTEGDGDNPNYDNYASLGHREAVLVQYNPNIISYENLVEHIVKHGDPTDNDGSFYDRGFQYAPAIYFSNESEKLSAAKVIDSINSAKIFDEKIDLPILPKKKFWPAEEYHQDYAQKNPIRYSYYRGGSGRDKFINKYWPEKAYIFEYSNSPKKAIFNEGSWQNYQRPSDDQIRLKLSDLQYDVTREEGTERPFENEYDKNFKEGIYVDIISGEPLFLSKDKFDSGTGWPSFVTPINNNSVKKVEDKKLFVSRVEVRSKFSDSHLGHVFEDGPKDRGGLRYCMNSASMIFIAKENMEEMGYGYLLDLL